VLKQIGGMDLVADIRKVHAGGSLLDPSLSKALLERMRRARRKTSWWAA